MKSLLPFLLALPLIPLAAAQEPPAPPSAETSASSDRVPEDQAEPTASDPFAQENPKATGVPAHRGSLKRQALRLRLETWEAPALEASRRIDAIRGSSDVEALRAECLKGIEGISLVHNPMTSLDAATRATGESIVERIYPTEYEPPIFPGSVDPETKKELRIWKDVLEEEIGDATPTSFETRNTGQTLEAVAQPVAVEASCWDVSLSFEVVAQAGVESHGASRLQIKMPIMTSFRTGGLVRLKEGKWRMLSLAEPPQTPDSEPSGKRWITFVRIDPEN